MPDYKTPGVYVEEISLLPRQIRRQETTNAVFVGPTPKGPLNRLSRLITSLATYHEVYGESLQLSLGSDAPGLNFMELSVRAFFAEGGKRLRIVRTAGGNGEAPEIADYRKALNAVKRTKEFLTLAAPGATEMPGIGAAIHSELIPVCEAAPERRFALIDTPSGKTPAQARAIAQQTPSSQAALFYPWIYMQTGSSSGQQLVPPSGFLAGIIQKVDTQRGVHKAAANQVVSSATALERNLQTATINTLNPENVNCLRSLSAGNIRVWGSRTLSADRQWRYIPVRRLTMLIEHSLQLGLNWAVFEPNDANLWLKVRKAVSNFLYQFWRDGALQGSSTKEAYFVRCGWATMSHTDIANRRLIVQVGFAPLKPAEFVVLRLALKTA